MGGSIPLRELPEKSIALRTPRGYDVWHVSEMHGVTEITVHVLLFISLYFEVLLLIAFFEKFSTVARMPVARDADLPSVTIVVPCHNEERTVSDTIESLLRLDYPHEKLSLVVVDDGSTDNTLDVARRFESERVRIHSKENGGKYSALNLAIERSESEFIGCLDADSFVHPSALRRIIPYFADPRVMAVTPAITVHNPRTALQLVQRAEYMLSVFIRRAFSFLGSIFITPGPFSIFRTQVFRELGGFRDAHHTEDLELGLRLQEKRYRIENAHDAYVYTVGPATLGALIRQRVRWTYGFLKNAFDYRHMFFNPRYGTLGMIVLPIVTLSVFTGLYFAGLLITRIVSTVADKVNQVQLTSLAASAPAVDWFFLNTGSYMFIIATLVLLTVSLIMIGRNLVNEPRLWSRDLPLYILLYGFIAPLWLARAVMNAAFSRKESWK